MREDLGPGRRDGHVLSHLPADVLMVLREFRTAEMATLDRAGRPVTWPVLPFLRLDQGIFQVTTPIGLPDKALRVRRRPQVSMLFSDPTGSGLERPPAVLVQGDATSPDIVQAGIEGFREDLQLAYQRQPKARLYGADPLSRRLVGWYFLRLVIDVVPLVVRWWPEGDFGRRPEMVG
ncbi:MAG: pyridoxamine 5'-phosphate oxidase family protein [Actinomycetota bacterium]|nr:pyridoxamine 5'-phosphate oxidase family protein [Actinomycetota bacterium]